MRCRGAAAEAAELLLCDEAGVGSLAPMLQRCILRATRD
jgi:hypothetical protein